MPIKMIALIRGINVGKAKRVAMADLRALVEELGFCEVRTVLNSGNVVFTSNDTYIDTLKTAEAVEEALYARTGVSAKVMVFTEEELNIIVKENSLAHTSEDLARLLTAFVEKPEHLDKLKPLEQQCWTPEVLVIGTGAAYIWCPDGILNSKLPGIVNSILGNSVTTRNWATVMKLHSLIKK